MMFGPHMHDDFVDADRITHRPRDSSYDICMPFYIHPHIRVFYCHRLGANRERFEQCQQPTVVNLDRCRTVCSYDVRTLYGGDTHQCYAAVCKTMLREVRGLCTRRSSPAAAITHDVRDVRACVCSFRIIIIVLINNTKYIVRVRSHVGLYSGKCARSTNNENPHNAIPIPRWRLRYRGRVWHHAH